MTAKFHSGGGGGAWDYEQDLAPAGEAGETWYDTGEGRGYVHDGGGWVDISHPRPSPGVLLTEDTNGNFNVDEANISHDNISGVTASDHHARPGTGANLAEDANGNFDVQQGSGSGLDADTVDGHHVTDHGSETVTLSGGENYFGINMGTTEFFIQMTASAAGNARVHPGIYADSDGAHHALLEEESGNNSTDITYRCLQL